MKNLILLFAALTLFSCKKEEVNPVENQKYNTYSARIGYSSNEFNIITFDNDLGNVEWVRMSIGVFKGYFSSGIPVQKTFIYHSQFDHPSKFCSVELNLDNTILIKSFIDNEPSDLPMIEGVFLEVKVKQ